MIRGPIIVLLALLTGVCGVLEPRAASMSVEPDRMYGEYSFNDEVFVAMTDLNDPKGLAGLEVRVYWQGSDTLMFTATDLPSPSFEVPNDGSIWVEARLQQDGETVSEGRANWYLDPGAKWTVYVNRVKAPMTSGPHPDLLAGPNPIPCGWWWCHQLWRFELREDVRNRPLEALWLVVYRWHPDECADICP